MRTTMWFVLLAVLPAQLVASAALAARSSNPILFGGEGSADWMSKVERAVVEKEYEASAGESGLQAPNRRHGFRVYFGTDGVRLHERTAAESAELARLRMVSFGRGAQRIALPAGALSGPGKRVTLSRAGLGVEEVFENSPAGLRQTLTIAERPPGTGDLTLVFRVDTAVVERAADGVALVAPHGRRLEMRRLPASDSSGMLLASRLEATGGSRVRFTVAERAAVYPLVVEFLFTGGVTATLQGNEQDANFGWSVAGAGDVNGDGYADVVVGANHYDAGVPNQGAAFVFLGSPVGIANGGPAVAATTLLGGQGGAEFGASVSSAGDVNGDGYADIVVGANQYDSPETNEGAAFVFLGSATGVASGNPATAAANIEGNQIGANFGSSVAAAGDVNGDGYADVVIGAPFYDSGEANEGAAFVFAGSSTGIISGSPASAAATLQGNQASAFFGASVAAAGDVNGDGYSDVLVGAYLYDTGEDAGNEGAAFVFAGSAAGVADGGPGNAATTLASDQIGAQFGWSVAGAGDVNGDGYADVVVGANLFDNGTVADSGGAFVFLGGAGGVASGGQFTAATSLGFLQQGAQYGYSVAGAGDVNGDGRADLLVGAWHRNVSVQNDGEAFLYLGKGSGLAGGVAFPEAATLSVGQLNAEFGVSVAGAGDVDGDGYADVVVGAHFYDAGETDEGAAFVYRGSASGISSGGPANAAKLLGSSGSGFFGFSVASAGDVNADGYSDVLVGAFGYDSGEAGEGAAFLFLGGASAMVAGSPAAAILQGNQANAEFGRRVAGAGDVNGDGYADVVVGAPGYQAGEAFEGAAFVFLGSASGISSGGPANAAATLQGDQVSALFGRNLAAAGDVNGDGYADLIIGAQGYDWGDGNEGAAFVFLGSAAGVASGGPISAATILKGDQAAARFGIGVAGAGDVNGDGYADVLVGAFDYDSGETDEGAAFLFLGSSLGIVNGGPATAAATLQGNQAGAEMGLNVAAAGDVNADGYADVIVGAALYDAGETDEGAAFLFLGGAAGIVSGGPANAAATLQGNQAFGGFGYSVATAGDVNGDGYADVVVGARFFDSGQTDEGAAFVFHGGAAGIVSGGPASAAATLQSNQADANLGVSVATAGDVNGDGFADVVVGAFGFDAATAGGAAFVFLGNDRAGRPLRSRQLRPGSSTPVQPWGSSRNLGSFDVRMSCNHPEGGGRVKLEVEACPASLDFGMSGCTTTISPTWVEVTATTDVRLTQPLAGLTASRLYRWRARTLYAPAAVTAAGITPPPKPAHGPWRRLAGQTLEADIRTLGGVFYTLAPCRVVDTRSGSGAPIGGPVLSSGVERMLPLAGKCGVPANARAISANLTAIDPTGPGSLVLYPMAGGSTPTSNLNFNTSLNRANNSMLGLNRLGQAQVLAVVNNVAGVDQVHLVVDVNGWFE